MSIAACAENTMNILKVQVNQVNDKNSENFENSDYKEKEKDVIFFKNTSNDSDDDEMFVIILEENVDNNDNDNDKNKNNDNDKNVNNDNDKNVNNAHPEKKNDDGISSGNIHVSEGEDGDGDGDSGNIHVSKNEKIITPKQPKQKYIDMDVYTHLQNEMESQKMYPLLPCNMISSFARVMEYVEYFDIPSEERKKLVVDLVKILAYSNNDYGSRECFEYFVEHNMIDDIIKTIIDSTKNRYDINRFPHTNRKIVMSCVSISNKIKIVKPNVKIESLFEEFKINLCGLKRFFKMKEKEESKQT